MIKKNKILNGNWALTGARIYDPFKKKYLKGDILLKDGKFDSITDKKIPEKINRIDCNGKIITHAFTDIHVHLREPGREDKETIETGCLSAMAGGFTTICSMPNTDPPIDSPESIRFVKDKSNHLPVNVLPIGAITKGQEGKELAEIGQMVNEGAVAISDDGIPLKDSRLMRFALEYSKMFDIPVINHAEDVFFKENTIMNEGKSSTVLGLTGNPDISESIMVSRDLLIADYVDGRIHIPHVSSKKSLEIIKKYKKKGIRVTAETTPHHIFFNDSSLLSYNSNLKVAPPIKGESDRIALIKGIKDGTIDCIASDHAPHTLEDKEHDICHAECGMIGLETSFSASYTALSRKGLGIEEIIPLFVNGPMDIINRSNTFLTKGESVELVVICEKEKWTVGENDIFSKSSNSAFLGEELVSRIELTISDNNCFGFIDNIIEKK